MKKIELIKRIETRSQMKSSLISSLSGVISYFSGDNDVGSDQSRRWACLFKSNNRNSSSHPHRNIHCRRCLYYHQQPIAENNRRESSGGWVFILLRRRHFYNLQSATTASSTCTAHFGNKCKNKNGALLVAPKTIY